MMIKIDTKACQITLNDKAITVLFGSSGVGKSTLLKQLAGHQRLPGSLYFNEELIEDKQQRSKPEQRNFCYLSQRLNLITTLTVKENLQLALKFSTIDYGNDTYEKMIAMVEIESLLERPTSQLSGGEYQLVSFCMAMLSASRWILLDEPFSAVDKARLHRVLTRFKRWHHVHKAAVLYVTHDVHEMALIADEVLYMTFTEPAQLMTYQSLIQSVDSDFIANYNNENILEVEWLRTEDNIQLLQLKDDPEQVIWALGSVPDESLQWLSVPLVDISLSKYKLMDSSILNQLEGLVEEVGKERDGNCYVSLRVGKQMISARITEKSRRELNLRTGVMCVVCFKAPRLIAG